jgi:uncharacterized protein (DUF927 family)
MSFINYTIFNPINISEGDIKCLYKKYKNKKFFNPNIITIHLLPKGSLKNTYVGLHTENFMFLTRP